MAENSSTYESAWLKDWRFREAGRGSVAFEAFAHNDVTLVFWETVGSRPYHCTRDSSPHYTVILGSHRNCRLKIEVNGKTVVDVEGVGLCCASAFQSYWICICDGLISVGKGKYPFQNLELTFGLYPLFSVRFQYRRSSYNKDLLCICDGDSNGVLFFAGTSYGGLPGLTLFFLRESASRPHLRFTDPKGTSFVGPRTEDGRNCSWWMIDIGKDRQAPPFPIAG